MSPSVFLGSALSFAFLLSPQPVAQSTNLRAQVEQALRSAERADAIAALRKLGAGVVLELVTIAERGGGEESAGAFRGFGGGRGGWAGGIPRRLYPRQRPKKLDEVPLPPPAERGVMDLQRDFGQSESYLPIHDDDSWRKTDSDALRAADMIGEFGLQAAEHLKRIEQALGEMRPRAARQLESSLGRIGRPAVPTLLRRSSKGSWGALFALQRMGEAAGPGILMHLRKVDPKTERSHTASTLWAILDRVADPLIQKRKERELPRWAAAPSFELRMFVARFLAKEWRGEPERFVEAFATADSYARYTYLEAMLRQKAELSAAMAVVLLDMIRDADRGYAPGILAHHELTSGDEEGLRELGRQLAHLIPGQPFATTLAMLRIAKRIGSHAAPLRPWLENHRAHASPRLTRLVEECLGALERAPTELQEEARPGLLAAWRKSCAKIATEELDQKTYREWRERLGDDRARKAALAELDRDDYKWAYFLERELETLYRAPRASALRLAPSRAPEKCDHEAAMRWLQEGRCLPAKAEVVHRAFERKLEAPAESESERLLVCEALSRFVPQNAWQSNWDAHKHVALLDADADELRVLNWKLVQDFCGYRSHGIAVDRLAFPQRFGDTMQHIAADAQRFYGPLYEAIENGDEQQRLTAYLIWIAAHRKSGEKPQWGFSVYAALDDWQEDLALLATELIAILPKGSPLLNEFGWAQWMGFSGSIGGKNESPELTARKLMAVAGPATPDWLHVSIEESLFEHPLPRAACLVYLRRRGHHSEALMKLLTAVQQRETNKTTPDAAFLRDLGAVLKKMEKK